MDYPESNIREVGERRQTNKQKRYKKLLRYAND